MFGDARRRMSKTGLPRQVVHGGKIITILVRPESDAARGVQGQFDVAAWIPVKSAAFAFRHRKVLGQRAVTELFINPRAGNRNREGLFDISDDAGAVNARRQVALVFSASAVDDFFAARGASGRVRCAKYANGIYAMRSAEDDTAKVGWRPRQSPGKQAGGKQKDHGEAAHGIDAKVARGTQRVAFGAGYHDGERKPLSRFCSLFQAQAIRGVLWAIPTRPRRSSRMIPP